MRGLMSHDKRNRFYSLTSRSHGEGFKQGKTCDNVPLVFTSSATWRLNLAGGEVGETTEEVGLASGQGTVMPGHSLGSMM